jgi:hypothetical protein
MQSFFWGKILKKCNELNAGYDNKVPDKNNNNNFKLIWIYDQTSFNNAWKWRHFNVGDLIMLIENRLFSTPHLLQQSSFLDQVFSLVKMCMKM